jgi:transposase
VSGPWTKEEDVQLVDLLFEHKASFVDAAKQHGRSEDQCRQRWRTHLDPDINHGQFSRDEDRALIIAHSLHGNKWAEIAKSFVGRPDAAIKGRWHNTLKRRVKEANDAGQDALTAAGAGRKKAKAWSREEERSLIIAHSTHGNKWAEIAKRFEGRTQLAIEFHWYAVLKHKVNEALKRGLDALAAADPAAQETAATALHGPVTSTPYSPSTGNATAPSPFGTTAAGENLFASPKLKVAARRGVRVEVQTTFFSNQ